MPAPLPLISANQFNETTNPEAPSEEGAGETDANRARLRELCLTHKSVQGYN